MKYKTPSTHISKASLLFAIGMLGLNTVHAQEAPPASTDDTAEEIVITGMRQSLEKALAVKQSNDHVMEALSLDDINSTPSVTIAEALVRLPGINGTRDRGNESQAAIRGLGPRMVFSTLNGREIASSEPGRAVRYEQFPSEMMSAVEVYKTQSADLVEGGIAGTINLKTISPLDHKGPEVIVRGGLQTNDGGDSIPDYNALGNRYSISAVHQFSDQFAWAVGYSSQKQKNAYESLQGWGMNLGDASGDNAAIRPNGGNLDGKGTMGFVPWGAAIEVKELTTERQGFLSSMEFKPTDDLDIKYDFLYTNVDISEEAPATWYQDLGNWAGGNNGKYSDVVLIGNQAVSATANGISTVRHVISSYNQGSTSTTQGINFKYTGIEGLEISGDLNASRAERDGYWNAIFFDQYGQTINYDFRAGSPGIKAAAGSSSLTPAAAGALTFPSWDDWHRANENDGNHLEDKMYGGNLDFKKSLDAGDLIGVDFGVRTSRREKENTPTSFVMTDPVQSTAMSLIPANYFKSFSTDQFPGTPLLYAPSYKDLAQKLYGGVKWEMATLLKSDYWDVEETNNAGYIKFNFQGEIASFGYNANIGVRQVSISTDSTGYIDDLDSAGQKQYVNEPILGKDNWVVKQKLSVASTDYNYTLPSLNLNVDLDETKKLRFGVARAISRPPVDELRAGSYLNLQQGATAGSAGNPYLKPYTSDQVDVSYEWYFAKESMAALSVFYKDIDNYIGISTIGTFKAENQNLSYTITGPINGKGGYVRGLEATFQMPFDFLPIEGFGIYSNYAHAESNIMEYTPSYKPYTMAGLAEHTATVDLWYSEHGVDARLGWKYTSAYTSGFTWDGGALNTLDPETTLNFSISYDFTDNISARFQVSNITNEGSRLTRDNSNASLMRYDAYGRYFLTDVTFKF